MSKVFKKIKVTLFDNEKGNSIIRKGRVSEYEVLESEKDTVHVEMEKVVSKTIDGVITKTSVPMIQKFDIRAWNNMRAQARKLGFNYVKVLHAPKGIKTDMLDPVKNETRKAKK